jgi:hypothetical protein
MKKTLTPKQMKIAGAAKPTDKITGADFKALKKGKDNKKTMNKKKGM